MAALTTLFTAPATCSAILTWDGALFWQGGIFQTGDPNCFPASFADTLDSWYSPGVCPHGWTSAGHLTGTGAGVTLPASLETNALCCPSGYVIPPQGAADPAPGSGGIFCRTQFAGALSDVFSTSTLAQGPLPESTSLTTIDAASLASAYGWEDVIQVRWQSTDQEVLSLMSMESSQVAGISAVATSAAAPSDSFAFGSSSTSSSGSATPRSTTSEGAASTRAPTSTAAQTAIEQSSSGGLSNGAQAGIGVGVAVVGLVVIALVVWLIMRRRRGQHGETALPELDGRRHERAQLDQKSKHNFGAGDLDSGSQINEMEGQRDRSELGEGRRHSVHEMMGS